MSLSLQHCFYFSSECFYFPSEIFYFPPPVFKFPFRISFLLPFTILFLFRVFFYFSPSFFVRPFTILPFRFFFLRFSIFKRILLSFSFFKLFLLFFGIFIVSFLIFKYRRKRNCVNFLLDKKFLKRISKASLGHV